MLPVRGTGVWLLEVGPRSRGALTLLGTRTLTFDNAHATVPFGTIERRRRERNHLGQAYLNFGWALTQQRNSSLRTVRR